MNKFIDERKLKQHLRLYLQKGNSYTKDFRVLHLMYQEKYNAALVIYKTNNSYFRFGLPFLNLILLPFHTFNTSFVR